MSEEDLRLDRAYLARRDAFAAAALEGLCAKSGEMTDAVAPEIVAQAFLLADYALKLREYSKQDLVSFLKTRAEKRQKEVKDLLDNHAKNIQG